ncbi:NYN domain-containing protein [Mycolicibacterium tusciae]|uniref:NYN domain-containing protein n=1 Tax=Mycolicibacterium tusciae TaxID=75922 RepID=UPI00024A47E3|nr:NYN domain-containing protein [Mycolicibacterium tusciae]
MTAALESTDLARTAVAVPRMGRHRSCRPRTFNLVDLENLVGGRVDAAAVCDVWSEFGKMIDTRHTDLTTVAVSRRHAATAFLALPANLHRVIGANVPDGADTALIDSVDVGWIAANFGQVVIASGDHIFAPLARRLRSNGLHVVQVIGRGACSAALYRACNEQKYLTNSPETGVSGCPAEESVA